MSLIDFNSEQKLIQGEVRKFAKAEIEAKASELDKARKFPWSIMKRLGDLGLSYLIVPEKYGGSGLGATFLCIAIEELAKVSGSIATILAANNCLVAFPIMKYGSEAQKNQYLKKLVQGTIGGYVLRPEITDEEIDVSISDGTYVVAGRKDFVLNGESAGFLVLPLSLKQGKVIFVMDKDNSTIANQPIQLMGAHAAGIQRFEFNDTKLTQDMVLVPETKGEQALNQIQDFASIGFSAAAIGIGQAALDASIKYSKERKQFGRPICEFSMVQEMLSDMSTRVQAARLLVYDAAAKFDKGENSSAAAKIARLYSGDAAVFAGIKGVQVHGGYGYTRDYPVERYLRDAKVLQVLEQTPQDLKSQIAKELLT